MAGYTHRIGELMETLQEKYSKNEKNSNNFTSIVITNKDDVIFDLKSVSYATPNSSEALVNDLNLTVCTGKNILITGKTGCGKSSLLRVLSDIWKPLRGEVFRNVQYTPNNILFLPQRVMLSDGTLKQQVIYPHDEPLQQDMAGYDDDDKILDILDDVDLSSVCNRVGGINVDGNWDDMLSPGEMQRLAFARLFYHKPIVALLDEATSALDVLTERRMHELCGQLGITLVSVGHRQTLLHYHNLNLRLDGQGGWSLTCISSN